MKKVLITLCIVLVLISFGCKTKSAQTTGNVQIIFWHALGGPLGDALNQMVEEFNKTHEGITVKAINMGNYQALSQKIMASIQAGTQPNISQVYESWTAGLAEGQALVDLSQMIDKDPEFKKTLDDIYPVFLQSNTLDGKILSFPFNKSVRAMFYNKDLFFQNKLDPNKPPVTWSDFQTMAKKLTLDKNNDKKTDVYGTTITVSAWQFENLLLQAGGEIMNADNTKPLFNSPEGVRALNFMSDLLNKDKSTFLSSGFDGQNDFLAGKVAMLESSSVSLAFLKKTGISFNLGICAIPVDKTKKSIISGTNVAIFKNKDPKVEAAAWEFIKWFTDTKQTAKFSSMTYYMPVRKSAMSESVLQTMIKENPGLETVYDQLNYATYEPQMSQWFEVRKFLEDQVIERVLRKDIAPKKALDDAAKKMNEELKKK